MSSASFVVVGSGGGGGTIAWVLAKAGHEVTLLEQGDDLAASTFSSKHDDRDPKGFDRGAHDEHRFRLKRPDPKRRLRGDYNTFRRTPDGKARPFKNGWTGSTLGGGSVIWGTWAYRALPVDFKLETTFRELGALEQINKGWDYSVADWPIGYGEMEPYYNVAEALLAVSGDQKHLVDSIKQSAWYTDLAARPWFESLFPEKWWGPRIPYPCPPFPMTPVGRLVYEGMKEATQHPCELPSALVQPGSGFYNTRQKLAEAAKALGGDSAFWESPEKLWSDRVRQACNMCGFCGEFLCWGGGEVEGLALKPGAPKSGTHSTVLEELRDLEKSGAKVRIITNAKVYEVLYKAKTQRAQGVRYLDVTKPDEPRRGESLADFVILSPAGRCNRPACSTCRAPRQVWATKTISLAATPPFISSGSPPRRS